MRTFGYLYFLFLVSLIPLNGSCFPSDTPKDFVESFITEVSNVSSFVAKERDVVFFEKKLESVIYKFFDVISVSKSVLGQTWKKINEKQKKRFARLIIPYFTLSYGRYLSLLKRYKGRFVISDQIPNGKGYIFKLHVLSSEKKGVPITIDIGVSICPNGNYRIENFSFKKISLFIAMRRYFQRKLSKFGGDFNAMLIDMKKFIFYNQNKYKNKKENEKESSLETKKIPLEVDKQQRKKEEITRRESTISFEERSSLIKILSTFLAFFLIGFYSLV